LEASTARSKTLTNCGRRFVAQFVDAALLELERRLM